MRSHGGPRRHKAGKDAAYLLIGTVGYQLAAFGVYGLVDDSGSPLHRDGAAWAWSFIGGVMMNVALLPLLLEGRALNPDLAWITAPLAAPIVAWAVMDAANGADHPELLVVGSLAAVSLLHALWSLLWPAAIEVQGPSAVKKSIAAIAPQ